MNKIIYYWNKKDLNWLISKEEKTLTKSVYLSGRTTRVLPSLHQWLSGPCHFFLLFFSLIIAWNAFDNFFFFSPIFLLKQPEFRKKSGFLLRGQGGLPSLHPQWSNHYKNHFFICVFPNWLSHICHFKQNSYSIYHTCRILFWRREPSYLEATLAHTATLYVHFRSLFFILYHFCAKNLLIFKVFFSSWRMYNWWW